MRNESDKILSVSALTAMIKGTLESGFPSVAVEGEISNLKSASSGHLYFSLKDREAMIQAVMFRYRFRDLSFEPKDGMKVQIRGGVSLYAQRGQYQLLVESMRRAGEGEILAMLEERRRALAAEGLFDEARKKPLPRLPEKVGVVTSPTGAALRDILNVLGRRNSGVGVIVLGAAVQGAEAAGQIAARIRQANRLKLVDVLIVGRGGGSLEDLLAFSDEKVVRAVADSEIPVVSAVGHEVDWALCDYAADLRAPTPSAAAELVSESRESVQASLEQASRGLATVMRSRFDYARMAVARFSPADVEARFMRLFLPLARRHDEAREGVARAVSERFGDVSHRIGLALSTLELASPQAVLERGYAVVRRKEALPGIPAGSALRDARSLIPGDMVDIRFAKGESTAQIREVRK
ncbi:MAG: exodeoxyribonuclease VII large subunit [Rectinemataceae bacterium]